MAVIDEAWSQPDFTLVDALDPTMITRPDPMFVLTSTVGDGTDVLLSHFQELGRTSVDGNGDGAIAFFEWSAAHDDAVDDRDVWWRTHPALGHTIDEHRLADRLHVLKADQFARVPVSASGRSRQHRPRPGALAVARRPSGPAFSTASDGRGRCRTRTSACFARGLRRT